MGSIGKKLEKDLEVIEERCQKKCDVRGE